MAKVTLIAAMDKNNVIGYKGKIPWHCPADLKWFKRFTENKAVVMGRKTHDSIGRALPNRKNIVLVRNIYSRLDPAVTRTASMETALEVGKTFSDEVVIMGGGKIYKEALPYVDEMYISLIPGEYQGDSYFPPIDPQVWSASVVEEVKCEKSDITYTLLHLTRR